jgi:hypothetical protein
MRFTAPRALFLIDAAEKKVSTPPTGSEAAVLTMPQPASAQTKHTHTYNPALCSLLVVKGHAVGKAKAGEDFTYRLFVTMPTKGGYNTTDLALTLPGDASVGGVTVHPAKTGVSFGVTKSKLIVKGLGTAKKYKFTIKVYIHIV